MSLFCSGRGRKPEVRLIHTTGGVQLFPETCCTSLICTSSVVNLQSRYVFLFLLNIKSFHYLNSVWFVASWKPLLEFLICFWFSDKRADVISVPGTWRRKIIVVNVILELFRFCRAAAFTEKWFISKYPTYQRYRAFHLLQILSSVWATGG